MNSEYQLPDDIAKTLGIGPPTDNPVVNRITEPVKHENMGISMEDVRQKELLDQLCLTEQLLIDRIHDTGNEEIMKLFDDWQDIRGELNGIVLNNLATWGKKDNIQAEPKTDQITIAKEFLEYAKGSDFLYDFLVSKGYDHD